MPYNVGRQTRAEIEILTLKLPPGVDLQPETFVNLQLFQELEILTFYPVLSSV